jgi:beta-galactosidase
MIQWVNGRGDYSREATRMYQSYLKNKYKKIEELNKVYPGSNFKDFKEVKQIPERQKHGWQDFWDWADFYRVYFADYYKYLYELATKRGINTPVIANIPQFIDFDVRGRGFASPMTTSFYKYIPEKARNIVFGGAYQMRRMDYENFHDVCITTQVVKSLTNYSKPVVCAELQTGIMRDKPRLYASDVELNMKTSMASGVDGVNCYMFSGGDNPDNIGMFGKIHRWQAPVSPGGKTDDKYEVLTEHGEFIKTFGSILAKTKPIFQTTVGLYNPYYGTEFLSNTDCGFLVYARDRYFFDGIGRLLSMGSTGFNIIDLTKSELDPAKIRTLLVFSLSFMEKDVQDKLIAYVRNGGKLLLFPELPENDLSGKKCTKLIDKLGIKIVKKVFPSIVNVNGRECFMEGGVSVVKCKGTYKRIATVDKQLCALSKKYAKGKFVFMGYPMPHYYDYHVDILDGIMKDELDVNKNIHINPKDIVGLIRVSDKGSFLFLMNYHQKKYKVDVNVKVPEYGIDLNVKNIYLDSRSGKILPVNVGYNNKLRLRFSTVEILSINMKNKIARFKIKGCPGEEARLSLDIKNKPVETKKHILQKKIEEIEITCE